MLRYCWKLSHYATLLCAYSNQYGISGAYISLDAPSFQNGLSMLPLNLFSGSSTDIRMGQMATLLDLILSLSYCHQVLFPVSKISMQYSPKIIWSA